MFGFKHGRLGSAGTRTLIQRAITSLRARGSDAHLWLPGVGTLNGLTTGNYLESTGNTLGTVDNPCGLVLDALGSVSATERVTNGTFETDVTGWASVGAATIAWDASKRALVNVTGGGGGIQKSQTWALTTGSTYRLSFDLADGTYSGGFDLWVGGALVTTNLTAGSKTVHFVAPSADPSCYLSRYTAATGTAYFDNISVREVSGIHLTQGTTANKPVLQRGLWNILPYSNTFSDASWTKASGTITTGVSDPIGGTAASTLTATSANGEFYKFVSGTASAYTRAIWIKRRTGTGTVLAVKSDLSGSDTVTVTNEWTLFVGTPTGNTASSVYLGIKLATSGDAVDVYNAGLFQGTLTASEILAAGGIPVTTTAAASNPDAGKYSWAFDGSNDSFLSGNLGITNACTIVIAGRLDSFVNITNLICEDSGGVRVEVDTVGGVTFDKAGVSNLVSSAALLTVNAPFVLTARMSGGTVVIRKNGAQVATAATALVFSATTGARIGAIFAGTSKVVNGTLGNVLALPVALTDAECLLVERMAASQFPNGPVF